ncbi:MAG TPA: hypothetical protein PK295_02340 [Candidatus Magasanikbacteria bacterium]|nr:hypothetical protein [Candidatus Magasanikbacteria bacterium]
MKKLIAIKVLLITALLFVGTFGSTVYAQNLGIEDVHKAGTQAGFVRATETTLAENIGRIITVLFSILGVLFTVLIVYAGYLWMTARGEDEQVTKAKNIIGRSVIGLIILMAAYSITRFVVPRVLEGSVNTPTTETPATTP